MKKVINIIIILLLIILCVTSTSIYARSTDEYDERDERLIQQSQEGKVITDNYKPSDLGEDDYKSAFEKTSTIVGGITTVGIVVAILGLMLIGIKYMLGSVEQKAEYKKSMIPYIVGCVFLFAIGTIVSIIYSLATQL